MKADAWFRAYTRAVDNPKLQTMDPSLFRQLFNFWCLAKLNDGILPPASEIAWRLRQPVERIEADIKALLGSPLRLLERNGKDISPMEWEDWQTKSSTSAERMAVKRKRDRVERNKVTEDITVGNTDVTRDVTVNVTEKVTQRRGEERRREPLTPCDPVEAWVSKLCDRHPGACDPLYPTTFCEDNWHRLGEDAGKYESFMAQVYDGLEAYCVHWEIDGNRFAKNLNEWLRGGGWRKSPPRVVERSNRPTDPLGEIEPIVLPKAAKPRPSEEFIPADEEIFSRIK